jgi:hypothetical protein
MLGTQIYLFWSLISLRHASGFINSYIVFANEDSFAQSIWKKNLASRMQSMMALGKRWFGFRRFKKLWRTIAIRAKAHRVDQNWQSLADKAQRGNHLAKNANLTCQDLVLSPTMKIWLWNFNEMCLKGLNLSSTRNSAFHHDLVLLQQAMNAVGVCSPQKWKHEHSGMIDFATFCCRWLDNHPFYLCQLKDSCAQAFWVSF